MTPRPDVSAERTAQIVEAAIAVFSRLGFHKARMDDIAREAGVSKGTLYWYFESRTPLRRRCSSTSSSRSAGGDDRARCRGIGQ